MNDPNAKDHFRELAEVLRQRARKMNEECEDQSPETRDNATLLMVLANIVQGKSVYRAFGAPGDWGYETPIGDALRACYDKPSTSAYL